MMAKYFEATCIVDDNGRIPLLISQRVSAAFKSVRGQAVHIVIEPPKRYSTNSQRQYYFGVIVKSFQDYFLSHGQWHDKDELHDMMMKHIGHLWIEEPNPFTGEITKKRRSYNALSTQEAEVYHMQCRAEAASRGIDIDEPNEGNT